LQGEYNQEDIHRAATLALGSGLRTVGIVSGAGVLMLLLLTVVVAVALGQDLITFLRLWLPAILFFVFVSGYSLALPRIQSRRLAKSPLLRGPMRGAATEEGLLLHSDLGESAVQWDAFVRFKMSDDVILLYRTQSAFTIVPRSLCQSDSDWQRLRQQIQARVPEKGPRLATVLGWLVVALMVLACILVLVLGVVLPLIFN